MRTEPVRAGAAWLALREPADAEARSPELVEELRGRLPEAPLSIHDLGCGTGAMVRWLAPRLPGPQHWVLHDRDADLLIRAAAAPPVTAADGAPVTVETRQDDITGLGDAELAGADLLTASALLDMMTADELGLLLDICVAAGCPVLVTLSVLGRVVLAPSDPLDAAVTAAFNAHQRRTHGAGGLLGPDAAQAAVDGFTRRGHRVLAHPSPWRLGPARAALATAWFTGWLEAACEQCPELVEAARPYARRRLREVASGSLAITVEHLDLLALPRVSSTTTS